VLDHVGCACAEFGGDTGQTGGHCFKEDCAESFGAGISGENEEVGAGVEAGEIAIADFAKKVDSVGDATVGG
jgi:hypothetical protein